MKPLTLAACLFLGAPIAVSSANAQAAPAAGDVVKDGDREKEPAAPQDDEVNREALAGLSEAERLNELGIKETRSSHFDEAIAHFKQAIRSDPRRPLYWNNLGSVYLSIGKYGPAVRAFQKAIRIDPNYAPAHYNLGAARDALLDYDRAVGSYARAFELDPALSDPVNNPPVVNNTHLTAVHLLIYQRQIGALGAALESTVESGAAQTKKNRKR